jgi:hypothetical protein
MKRMVKFACACALASSACGGTDPQLVVEYDALTASQEVTLTTNELRGIMDNQVQIAEIRYQVRDGHATFTPSPGLSKLQYDDPNGEAHKSEKTLEDKVVVLPDPFPNGTSHINALDLLSIAVALDEDMTLDATLHGDVSIHVPTQWPLPDIDFSIELVSVRAFVALNANADRSGLALRGEPVVQVTQLVHSCRFGPGCDAVLNAFLPSIQNTLKDSIAEDLTKELAKPETKKAIAAALDRYANALVRDDDPHWRFAGNLRIGGTTIRWNATRELAPNTPANCWVDAGCEGQNTVRCDNQPEVFTLERWISFRDEYDHFSFWATVATDSAISRNYSPVMDDVTIPATANSVEYRVCASNVTGTRCTPSFWATVNRSSCPVRTPWVPPGRWE